MFTIARIYTLYLKDLTDKGNMNVKQIKPFLLSHKTLRVFSVGKDPILHETQFFFVSFQFSLVLCVRDNYFPTIIVVQMFPDSNCV